MLSWSGPCYDGGSAIVGYVVEVNNQGCAENWVELTDQCESTSYIVCAGLQPNHEYCFRVRAFNAAGVSEPSPVSSAVRMEQKGGLEWVIKLSNLRHNRHLFLFYCFFLLRL